MRLKRNRKKIWSIGLLFCVVTIVFIYFLNKKPAPEPVGELNIVLSPHYDDGVLSLGGFVAHNKSKVLVATFFTKNSSTTRETRWDRISGFASSSQAYSIRHNENISALSLLGADDVSYSYMDFQYRDKSAEEPAKIRDSLIKTIESLIEKNKSHILNIYGPAYFGDVITHPDHKLLHQAFLEVAKRYAEKPFVSFFMYEDFPYVKNYNSKSTISLKMFNENDAHVELFLAPVGLSQAELDLKERAIAKYKSQVKAFSNFNEDVVAESRTFTSTRCIKDPCEMTYQVLFKK